MLKKKLLSSLLSVAMLSSLVAVNVSASGTDAIATDGVLIDTTEYDNLANLYNQIIQSSFNIYSNGLSVDKTGIGGDTNACLAVKGYSTTSTHAQAGYGKQSRFVLATYTPEYDASGKVIAPSTDTSNRKFHIANQTVPTYWSVDVFDNGAVSTITLQVNSIAMHTAVTKEQLTDNAWNTLAVVYYPNTVDNTKLGYADFYLNGEFIETKDMSSQEVSENPETRLGFIFEDDIAHNDEARAAYFDNIKVFEMTSFTRPAVDTSKVTVSGNVITNYIAETRREAKDGNFALYSVSKYDTTVAGVEALLHGTVYEADGVTEATDTANIQAGMKVKAAPNEIAGVGTFTDDAVYTFSNIAETYLDATGLTSWANGWNRVMGSITNMSVANGNSGMYDMDGNKVAAYKVGKSGIEATSNFKIAECYYVPNQASTTTESVPVTIDALTVPVYMSVDVYDNDVIDNICWETDGGGTISAPIAKESLNANAWNTFAVVYYPNTAPVAEGEDKMLGYADFYLNGKFVSTADLSDLKAASYGAGIRLSFNYTVADTAAYFDNHKAIALTDFVRPDIKAGSATVTGGTITGYTASTVAELETALGASIKNADGTDATDSAAPAAGMKAVTTGTVAGIGTFTNEYVLGAGGSVVGDWAVTLNGNALSGSTFVAGDVLVATIPVLNNSGTPITFTLIIAEYDGQGKLTYVDSVPVSDGDNSLSYTLKADHTYKLFAWESITNLKPIDKAVITLTE